MSEVQSHLRRFQRVVRVETKATIVGPALDLERSVESAQKAPP
jgi:hypothetical protein